MRKNLRTLARVRFSFLSFFFGEESYILFKKTKEFLTVAEYFAGFSPPFPEFVRRWHRLITYRYSRRSHGKFNSTIEMSCDRHFAPQIEACDLSNPFALSKYNYVLRFISPSQIANDTLKMLEDLGLSSYFYGAGFDGKQPLFEKVIHPSNSSSKMREFYDKETALLAYDILKRDYEVLGFDFPFPEWLT